jgi:hypothetical protein
MGSKGDPRVLFVLNLTLSFLFSTTVFGGLAFIGTIPFEWTRVAIGTIALMLVSYLVVLT